MYSSFRLCIYNSEDNELLKRVEYKNDFNINNILWSKDNTYFCAAFSKDQLVLVNAATGEIKKTFQSKSFGFYQSNLIAITNENEITSYSLEDDKVNFNRKLDATIKSFSLNKEHNILLLFNESGHIIFVDPSSGTKQDSVTDISLSNYIVKK